jgi:hypothetical protein
MVGIQFKIFLKAPFFTIRFSAPLPSVPKQN